MKTLSRILQNEAFSAYLLLPIAGLSIFLGHQRSNDFLRREYLVLGGKFTITGITLEFLLGFFFYNIGLELRYELAEGALRDKKILLVSALAAAFGMLVPALIFVTVNRINGTPTTGWGITMATDLPLVLALITILNKNQLKGFILAMATIDDVGSIVVLSILYNASIHVLYVVALIATLTAYFLFSYFFTSRVLLIVTFTIGLLLGHHTGIQTSLVSVLFGILTFNNTKDGINFHQKLIDIIEPFSAFFVVPIFVFVSLFRNFDFSINSVGSNLVVTLIFARVLGKPSGIFAGISLGRFLLRMKLPFSKLDSLLIGALGTLGLAVSLIFAENDFHGSRQDLAIMAILLTIPVGVVLSSVARFFARRD